MSISYRDEGRIAVEMGLSQDDNPYAIGTDAHAEWLEGFEAATNSPFRLEDFEDEDQ